MLTVLGYPGPWALSAQVCVCVCVHTEFYTCVYVYTYVFFVYLTIDFNAVNTRVGAGSLYNSLHQQ